MTPRTLDSDLVLFADLEGQRENLVEAKHRKLIRSHHRNGILDRDLKPNAKIRDELNASRTLQDMLNWSNVAPSPQL